MALFTNEEFDMIYKEVMEFESYNTLLELSQKALKRYVYKWCFMDPLLRGGGYEEDVIQEIAIKLLKNCMTGFFYKKEGGNYDPEGFGGWVYTLAKNVFKDFAKKIHREGLINTDKPGEELPPPPPAPEYNDEIVERLNRAFLIVMNADAAIYKTLTWITQMIIIANSNITKIESTDIMVRVFSSMKLDDMFKYVIGQANRIPWLSMDVRQAAEYRSRLDKKHTSGVRMGDMLYEDFYMKKGPKASISDWVNRINGYVVKEEFKNGTPNS